MIDKEKYEQEPGEYVVYARWAHKSKLIYRQSMSDKSNIFKTNHLDNATHIYIILKEHEEIANKVMEEPGIDLWYCSEPRHTWTKTIGQNFWAIYLTSGKFSLTEPSHNDFNSGYIKASQKAYDLLVIDISLNTKQIVAFDEGFYYIINDRVGYQKLRHEVPSLKQFYINNGALSWLIPNDEDVLDSIDKSEWKIIGDKAVESLKKEIIISIEDENDGKVYEFEKPDNITVEFYSIKINNGQLYIFGATLNPSGIWVAGRWCASGFDLINKYDLTPIKPKWHENKANFPALIYHKGDYYVATEIKEDTLLISAVGDEICYPDECRLATKQEYDSIYYEDK